MNDEKTAALAAHEDDPLSESTTTVNDFSQKMRDVQLGISDTMPDGTTLKEIHERNAEALAAQDRALVELEEKRLANKATLQNPPATKTHLALDPDSEVNVRTLADGTVTAEVPVDDQPKQDLSGSDEGTQSDIPGDYPGRKQLIAAGHTDYATVSQYTEEHLKEIAGIGPALSKKIVAHNESLHGGE